MTEWTRQRLYTPDDRAAWAIYRSDLGAWTWAAYAPGDDGSLLGEGVAPSAEAAQTAADSVLGAAGHLPALAPVVVDDAAEIVAALLLYPDHTATLQRARAWLDAQRPARPTGDAPPAEDWHPDGFGAARAGGAR